MDAITFRAVVGDEQIIRPPADVVLPRGDLEVSVKVAAPPEEVTRLAREAANERLRQCRVSSARATGIDNETIDADLARVAGESLETA